MIDIEAFRKEKGESSRRGRAMIALTQEEMLTHELLRKDFMVLPPQLFRDTTYMAKNGSAYTSPLFLESSGNL
jgi:hypothetical protein